MRGGYSAFATHPWHHYWAAGPSLLGLVLPFLILFLVAAWWRGPRERRAEQARAPGCSLSSRHETHGCRAAGTRV